MEQPPFPGLPMHRMQHESCVPRIAAFLEDHQAAEPAVPVWLLLFIENSPEAAGDENRQVQCFAECPRRELTLS